MEALWTDTLGKRHSLRSKRFRGSGFGAKKDRGKGFSVLTARELKREPKNVLFLILCSEPHRNTCYVGHKRHLISYLRRLHKISFQLPYKLCFFTFPLVLGCPLERAFAVLSFIKNFSSRLALRNRSVHPHATVTHSKKGQIFSFLLVEGNFYYL